MCISSKDDDFLIHPSSNHMNPNADNLVHQ